MKYKIGDKVRIRDDLINGHRYSGECGNSINFIGEMATFCGKVVEITEIIDRGFYKIKNSACGWSLEMFDPDFQAEQIPFAESEWTALMNF